MISCLVLVAVVVALWSENHSGASAAEYFSRTHSKLSAAPIVAKSDTINVPNVFNKDSLWSTIHTSPVSEETMATEHSKNAQEGSSNGDSGGSPQNHANSEHLESSFMISMDAPDSHTEIPSISVLSPMESLKQIWREMIAVPPSAAQLELILKGALHGYENSSVQTLSEKSAEKPAFQEITPASVTTTANSILNSTLLSNQFPLRANGTHKESLYRQVLSQFLDPLASEGKRSLWLDQELVLKLKGSVVFAHHPELWRDIGEGLKPKLNRGVRLLTPYSGAEEPGPTGVAPLHNIIVTALAHSVNANLAFLNKNRVEKVRDLALQRGLNAEFLTKANIVTALLDACEDGYVETGRPALVVINDQPGWLLSNEAASEVVLEELKSVSSRVMFVAVPPKDTLRAGDFAPSARPPVVSAPSGGVNSAEGEVFGGDASSPFVNLASLFGSAGPGGASGPAGAIGSGNGGKGKEESVQKVNIPPWFTPAQSGVKSDNTPTSTSPQPQLQAQQQQGAPRVSTTVVGRTIQVVLKPNGTLTMTPMTLVNGVPNGVNGGPPLPEHVMRAVNEQMQRFLQNTMHGNNNGNNNSTSSGGSGDPSAPAVVSATSVSIPMFPPTMSEQEIRDFMQNPANRGQISQNMDRAVKAFMHQLNTQLSMNLPPGAEMKVAMFPLNGPPAASMVPPEFLELAEKAFGADINNVNNDGGDSSGASEQKMEKGPFGHLPGAFFKQLKKRPTDLSIPTNPTDSHTNTNPITSTNTTNTSTTTKLSAHKPKNLSSLTHTSSDPDISSHKNVLSPSGAEIIQLFPEFFLEPPSDLNLKSLWDRICDDEVSSRMLKLNKRFISQELKKNKLKHSVGAVQALEPLLRRQLLSREEVRQSLRFALQLQAGKYSTSTSVTENTSSDLDKNTGSTTGGNDTDAGNSDSQSNDTSTDQLSNIGTNTDAISIPSSPLPSTTTTTPATTTTSTNKAQIVLSRWALDTAFSTILKVPTPRMGRPAARKIDDILSMVTDKHEKSLVGNVISPQDIGVTYDMIGGLEEVKEMLRQCITYPLKYPRLYQEGVASEAVKGVLLFGPPGTGKTMLAKAVATAGGATFLTIDASVVESKWLGESEKNAKAVFTLARRLAPCVVYLDEVDSILSSREQGDESSHGTLTSVKTTLMQEWDGLRTTKDRVVVIASTNRPFDLDEAVLRRLPRRILVDLPDLQTRQEILSVTLANNRVSSSVNFTQLAEKLEGYTGSDIKEVCREAVVRVAHERAKQLENGGESANAAGTPIVAHIAEGLSSTDHENEELNFTLRAVTLDDFKHAMRKLKASVNSDGRELKKVTEWNAKYGEFKRKDKVKTSSSHLSMYV